VTRRSLLPHVVLLAVASVGSIYVWTRDKKEPAVSSEATIWSGRPSDVGRVTFESKTKRVSLESKTDGRGRYFIGTAESRTITGQGDAAAPPPPPPKTSTFVSVGPASKLAEALAPLRALRDVGKIGDDRAAEFGLKEPDGTVRVVLAGTERKLTLGEHTPGGGDRYVKDEVSGTVYVVSGEVLRDLESGESALAERELHELKDEDIQSLTIAAHGKSRTVLRRGLEAKRIWADPSDPEKADETATNWIAKVDRLKPNEYLATQPSSPEIVVRVEYKAKGAEGVFVEVAKVPGAAPETSTPNAVTPAKWDYLVRTERTRWWAKTLGPVAEQVEQDIGSVLK
jgi:hypothetical protein